MNKKSISHKSRTDLAMVDKLKDKDIDFSDCPEITPEMFAKSIVRKGFKPVSRKAQLTLRMDVDVLEWFKKQGKGYQTRMNALLRAYMLERKSHEKSSVKN